MLLLADERQFQHTSYLPDVYTAGFYSTNNKC